MAAERNTIVQVWQGELWVDYGRETEDASVKFVNNPGTGFRGDCFRAVADFVHGLVLACGELPDGAKDPERFAVTMFDGKVTRVESRHPTIQSADIRRDTVESCNPNTVIRIAETQYKGS